MQTLQLELNKQDPKKMQSCRNCFEICYLHILVDDLQYQKKS